MGEQRLMYCVVLCQMNNVYLLRHIICNVSENEELSEIKKKYYEDYNEIETDEFHLCTDKEEVNKLLSEKNINTFF